jgi:rubrerythrin
MPDGGQTRRSLLQASAAGAGVVLLGGCGGGKHDRQRLSAAARERDIKLLNRALAIEQRSIALYTAGGPLLSGPPHEAARWFLSQELEHAGRLRELIKQLRGKAHNPDARYNLRQPRDQRQLLEFLHDAERQQIGAYLHAIPLLSIPDLRQAMGAIMANDAQHLAVLRLEQGLSGVPGPFLTTVE